jgi:hypothetical protein
MSQLLDSLIRAFLENTPAKKYEPETAITPAVPHGLSFSLSLSKNAEYYYQQYKTLLKIMIEHLPKDRHDNDEAIKQDYLTHFDRLLFRADIEERGIKLDTPRTLDEKTSLHETLHLLDSLENLSDKGLSDWLHLKISRLSNKTSTVMPLIHEKNVTLTDPWISHQSIIADEINIVCTNNYGQIADTRLEAKKIQITIDDNLTLFLFNNTLVADEISINGIVGIYHNKITTNNELTFIGSRYVGGQSATLADSHIKAPQLTLQHIHIDNTNMGLKEGDIEHCQLGENTQIIIENGLRFNHNQACDTTQLIGLMGTNPSDNGKPDVYIDNYVGKGFSLTNLNIITTNFTPTTDPMHPLILQDCFLEKGDIITDDLQTLGTTGVDVKTYFETCMPRTENASMIMQRLYANNLLTTFLYPTSNKEACELNEGCDDLIANDFIQFNEKICVNKTPLRFFNDRHIGRNALEKSFLQDTPSFNTEPVTETGNSFATLGSVFLVGAGFFTLMMLFVVCLYKKRMAESAKEQDPEHEYSYLIPHTMSINFN